MKEYLTYIVAACAVSCATATVKENASKPAEDYQVQPVVMKSTRDCNNLPPQELIDCITETEEESNTTTYVPAPITLSTTPALTSPTTSTYIVTPKTVKTTCDPNLSGGEMLKRMKISSNKKFLLF